VKQRMKVEKIDFEEFGYKTMLATGDEARAKEICALRLHEYEQELRPVMAKIGSEIQELRNRDEALHAHLYERPIAVSDAAMLVRSRGARTLLALIVLAAIASLAGNLTLFYLFGFGVLLTVLLGTGTTALPLAVGHLFYEKIVAHYKALQTALIVGALALCVVGLLQLGLARRAVVDKAAANETTTSFVDQSSTDTAVEETRSAPQGTESKTRETLGGAMFTMLLAADLILGLLAGLLTRLRTDEDYAAWSELKKIRQKLPVLEKMLAEWNSSVEIAKVRCMAGILRAQSVLRRRRPPYYRALAVAVLCASPFLPRSSSAQTIERYEGTLIDTSGSIGKGGGNTELFREYLFSTKKLLLTEPGGSRVWVAVISTDSFGGVQEVLRGWTPQAHGVFTDDLMRARRQLAAGFEAKSSGMAPVAAGTDIFGGLWHLKALFESTGKDGESRSLSKNIWIFSDMVNETKSFPMPALVSTGPEQMLERAKANGLVVSLSGYKIHVVGASPSGLTPQAWLTVKKFWEMYFSMAGAELVSYSAECEVER